MSGFLYFVPHGTRDCVLAEPDMVGLGHLGDAVQHFSSCEVHVGPDQRQSAGLILGVSEKPGMIGYYPDRQKWVDLPVSQSGISQHCEPSCVGFYTDDPPGPRRLSRHRMIRGHQVRLLDGQEWEIPLARQVNVDDAGGFTAGRALPARSRLDPCSGKWVEGQLDGIHRVLWDIATRWWDAVVAAMGGLDATVGEGVDAPKERITFEFQELHEAAATVLAANYMMGPTEISLAGLLDAAVCRDVLLALVDWPTIQAVLQKKTMNSRSSIGT